MVSSEVANDICEVSSGRSPEYYEAFFGLSSELCSIGSSRDSAIRNV